jgi:hypothetical protein
MAWTGQWGHALWRALGRGVEVHAFQLESLGSFEEISSCRGIVMRMLDCEAAGNVVHFQQSRPEGTIWSRKALYRAIGRLARVASDRELGNGNHICSGAELARRVGFSLAIGVGYRQPIRRPGHGLARTEPAIAWRLGLHGVLPMDFAAPVRGGSRFCLN